MQGQMQTNATVFINSKTFCQSAPFTKACETTCKFHRKAPLTSKNKQCQSCKQQQNMHSTNACARKKTRRLESSDQGGKHWPDNCDESIWASCKVGEVAQWEAEVGRDS